MQSYKTIVEPTVEPVSLPELRAHLKQRPTGLPDDADLTLKAKAARRAAEDFMGRACAEQTVEIALDAFPYGAIALPGGPVKQIISLSYLSPWSGLLEVTGPENYVLDDYSTPNWLLARNGGYWPAAAEAANAVRVRYIIGAGPIPEPIKAAIMLLTAELYTHRGATTGIQPAELPFGVRLLLQPYRLDMGV